ncbi:hypothetical protein MTR_6g078920 [Medicago truncatula]|uniref:Uncharacterized protein n=2 Tax=Medicago truncatula TaxID=3880 RepID=G7KL59_MEDTR|nr:hypothetical protein MTR_6g078920 [Medicago truncatula]
MSICHTIIFWYHSPRILEFMITNVVAVRFSLSAYYSAVICDSILHKTSPPHSVIRVESFDLKIVSCSDCLKTNIPAQSAPERKLQKITPKSLHRILSLQKECSSLHSQKAVMIWTIEDVLRSEDCKSFGSVSLPQQVDENLSHSFHKINVDQHCLDASDNNPSSSVELVNVIDSIFDSVERSSITKEELLQKIMNCLDFVEISMF